MASKAQKLKQKKRANAIRAQSAPPPDAKPDTVKRPPAQMLPKVEAIRPTIERMAKGAFRMPAGRGKQSMPAVDEEHDAIAKLHRARLISDDQEQAARDWQDLKAAIRAELGLSQGRSCLDMTPCGYDNDDGDPALMQRWERIEAELGSWKTGALDYTCVLGHPPANLGLLKSSLDAFIRAD